MSDWDTWRARIGDEPNRPLPPAFYLGVDEDTEPTVPRGYDMSTYPPRSTKVESKVKASTVGAYVGFSALLYVLQLFVDQPVLLTPLPDVIEPLVLGFIPSTIAFVAGYAARHTPR